MTSVTIEPRDARRPQTMRADTYKLTDALRQSTLGLHLVRAGVIRPVPVLATYRGVSTKHVVRQELYL